MGEQKEEQLSDVDLSDSELTFDNLTILKELSNITNLVKNEEFLETVPKAKLKRVKWIPMFNCLKQGIFEEMVEELSNMWKYENMHDKIEVLKKQKEKFAEIDVNKILWRPELGDVKAQLQASDISNLQKQKALLESLARDYENKVNRLKKTISAKRDYLRALQLDIQKYQKKNDDIIAQFNEKIENHHNLIKIMLPVKQVIDEINWVENNLDAEE